MPLYNMKKYFQAPWTIKDLLIILFSIIFFALAAYFLLGSTGVSLGFLIQWLIILGPLLGFTYWKHKLRHEDFGITKVGIWITIKEIIKAYLLFLGLSFLIGILVLYYDLKIPGYQIQESILPLFGESNLDMIIAGIIIILAAPIFEEIFFRGFLLRTLSDKLGIFLGSILSAALFAIAHFPWQSVIPIFILGVIINSIVLKTKSIIPAIAFHIFNNAIVFTLQLLIMKDVISIENLA